jgi:hypothetical protein
MNERDERVRAEAERLWKALFNEPPAIRSDGALMLDVLLSALPVQPYRPDDKRPYSGAHDACRDGHPRPPETDQQTDRDP